MRGTRSVRQHMPKGGRQEDWDLPPAQTAAFRKSLLRWFARHQRDLPWRRTPTPYRIWISEIMLQQTRVRTVLPYYQRFLKRFPGVTSLARARESEVLELWAGLGYYTRARNLHRAAIRIANEHGGRFPRTLEQLLSLPGIGRYTAGAIQSIAFNVPAPIVDGNVRRVICRLRGLTGHRSDKLFWRQAAAWIPPGRAAEFNQAIMELGSLICLPSGPLCPKCPVRNLCEAGRHGIADRIPSPRPKRAQESVTLALLIVECQGQVLLTKKHVADFIPGAWGLPSEVVTAVGTARLTATRLAQRVLGRSVALAEAGVVSHAITHRRIRALLFRARLNGSTRPPARGGRWRWAARSKVNRLLTSSLYRKALRAGGG